MGTRKKKFSPYFTHKQHTQSKWRFHLCDIMRLLTILNIHKVYLGAEEYRVRIMKHEFECKNFFPPFYLKNEVK